MTKTIISILVLLTTIFIMLSCDSKVEVDTGFKIVFSDGNIIDEQNIAFYDSSTFIFYLKEKLNLQYSTGSDNSELTGFNVQIDEDIIYNGIIWPSIVSMGSPFPIYISSCIYPEFDSDVLVIKFFDFNTDEPDSRNNPNLIDYLDKKQLLLHGLSCSVDSISLSTKNDSSIVIFTTLQNHDNVNYYLPDPEKMGDERYCYYTSRLYLKHVSSDEYFSPRFENSISDWNNIDMNYMTLLEGNSQISISFETKYATSLISGSYDIDYRFGNIDLCLYDQFEIKQTQGRIWVGEYFLHLDNTLIE